MAQRHKKIKIGILGGSFNPPHAGHVHISLMALKKLHLHQVWWVVSPQNPHKSANIKNTFKERIRLCEEITASIPKIKIKLWKPGIFPYAKKFYTYNLLKRLNAEYKYLEFYLIIGADNLIDFHKWYEFEKIAEWQGLQWWKGQVIGIKLLPQKQQTGQTLHIYTAGRLIFPQHYLEVLIDYGGSIIPIGCNVSRQALSSDDLGSNRSTTQSQLHIGFSISAIKLV